MDDVLIGSLYSSEFGPSLRLLEVGQFVPIVPSGADMLPDLARRLVRRWNLRFKLIRVASDDGPGASDPYPVPRALSFRLEAREFPSTAVWAEERPEQIGHEELVS
jgi:hypothetical protein